VHWIDKHDVAQRDAGSERSPQVEKSLLAKSQAGPQAARSTKAGHKSLPVEEEKTTMRAHSAQEEVQYQQVQEALQRLHFPPGRDMLEPEAQVAKFRSHISDRPDREESKLVECDDGLLQARGAKSKNQGQRSYHSSDTTQRRQRPAETTVSEVLASGAVKLYEGLLRSHDPTSRIKGSGHSLQQHKNTAAGQTGVVAEDTRPRLGALIAGGKVEHKITAPQENPTDVPDEEAYKDVIPINQVDTERCVARHPHGNLVRDQELPRTGILARTGEDYALLGKGVNQGPNDPSKRAEVPLGEINSEPSVTPWMGACNVGHHKCASSAHCKGVKGTKDPESAWCPRDTEGTKGVEGLEATRVAKGESLAEGQTQSVVVWDAVPNATRGHQVPRIEYRGKGNRPRPLNTGTSVRYATVAQTRTSALRVGWKSGRTGTTMR
jgi:hypothetical protein